MNASIRFSLATLSLAALAGCSAAPEPSGGGGASGAGDEPTASTGQAVESQYAGNGGFGIDTSSPSTNTLLAATGVVYVPIFHDDHTPWLGTDGSPIRATCGVTFISSHFAITAAHCVDGTDLPSTSDMFSVEQFDISAVPWSTVTASENETDSFFTGSPGYTFAQLTAAQGYKVTRYNQCHVYSRCSYDNVNCSDMSDVALIRCDDRPWFSPSIPVAASDDQQSGVSMEWYHEVYSGMPLAQPVYGTTWLSHLLYQHNEDRYQHYTLYPPHSSESGDQYQWEQSFHYYGGGKNQILPLESMDYREGDLFWNPTRLGKDPNPNNDPDYDVVWTDLWGCHGSSGSGIVQWVTTDGTHYTPQLLGPVSTDSQNSGLYTNLCDTYTGMGGFRQAQLAYPVLRHTQGIAGPALWDFPFVVIGGKGASAASAPAPAAVSAEHLYDGPPVQAAIMR
jgi:hypothetical protein